MSREIDLTQPLSDDEREYLEARGLQAQLDENARHLMGGGAPESTPNEPETEEPYKGVTIIDLKKMIEDRNADREDDKKIVAPAASAARSAFVDALVADDKTED